MKRFLFAAILSAFAVFVSAVNAQEVGRAQGEVRKVDKEASKVTLRHGPIEGLNMPAMSMVFQVKDAKILDQLKEGDKIRFTTAREGGALVLKSFEQEK